MNYYSWCLWLWRHCCCFCCWSTTYITECATNHRLRFSPGSEFNGTMEIRRPDPRSGSGDICSHPPPCPPARCWCPLASSRLATAMGSWHDWHTLNCATNKTSLRETHRRVATTHDYYARSFTYLTVNDYWENKSESIGRLWISEC